MIETVLRGVIFRPRSNAGFDEIAVAFELTLRRVEIDLGTIHWYSSQNGGPGGPVYPGGDRAFEFIGTGKFAASGGSQPQLRYDVVGGRTVVQMDGINGLGPSGFSDGVVDAEIELIGRFKLTAPDFLL